MTCSSIPSSSLRLLLDSDFGSEFVVVVVVVVAADVAGSTAGGYVGCETAPLPVELGIID